MLVRFLLVLSIVLVSCQKLDRGPAILSPPRPNLNYPPLPEDLTRRIQRGTLRLEGAPKKAAMSYPQWGLVQIGAMDARVKIRCSSRIVVAVVDTGIDYTHPDLVDNIWINPGESGPWTPPEGVNTPCRDKSCNGIDDDGNGFVDDVIGWDFVHDKALPYDVHGHGTHIAGIIAGAGKQILGVCPSARIMSLKYYDNSGAGYNNLSNTVRAFHYAIRMNVDLINYSGGGSDPAATERQAVEAVGKQNILLVAAAGNDGHSNDVSPYYPGSYPFDNILAVASVNPKGQLLPSSNFGTKSVHVAAPGLMIESTLPEGKGGMMSGTSQATAFVSGAAALLMSQFSRKLTKQDLQNLRRWIIQGGSVIPNAPLVGGELSIPNSAALMKKGSK